jgi:hypothetical protein
LFDGRIFRLFSKLPVLGGLFPQIVREFHLTTSSGKSTVG